MVFKINISHNGKTFKTETENEDLLGKRIGDTLLGNDLSEDLSGYEVKVTGTSDKSGFAGLPNVDGPNLKKVLLGYGMGMHKKPKGEGKVNRRPNGLRLRKTMRGNEISLDTVQINTSVIKEGSKKFSELFEKPEEPAAESN